MGKYFFSIVTIMGEGDQNPGFPSKGEQGMPPSYKAHGIKWENT